MKFLLDTQVLLWAAGTPARLSDEARTLIGDWATQLVFSAASIWEVAAKRRLGRRDLRVDPRVLRRKSLEAGYVELPVTGVHAVTANQLPPIHKDPFDRVLVAQAQLEGITLLTADDAIARYPGPIRLV